MRWVEIVNVLPEFDPEIPCKNCIVRFFCSCHCDDWKKRVDEWSEDVYEKAVARLKELKQKE